MKTWPDIMGRPTASTTYGPAQPKGPNPVSADSLRVEYAYDNEGNLTSTTRKFTRNSTPWALQSTSTYDGAGRVTYETSPNGSKTYALDPAGNVTSVTNGNSRTVYMTYDNLNRVTKRIVPQVSYTATKLQLLRHLLSVRLLVQRADAGRPESQQRRSRRRQSHENPRY